jgi:two-component system, OmpR family, phosphate regulon response regulator PhoB
VIGPALVFRRAPKILIVEDENAMAILLSYNLKAVGFDVETLSNGLDASVRLSHAPPDLVVLDWGLPGLSGIELLRRIRSKPQTLKLPVLMLTARSDPNDRQLGLDHGANVYLVKPFKLPEFLDCIDRLLKSHPTALG